MNRISTDMTNNDMQYQLRIREKKLNDIQNKIAGQTRIKELRDDPIAVSHSVRYKSHISRLKQFTENIGEIQSRSRIAEGYLQEAIGIMNRVNEIAVQGANGTYQKSDTMIMGDEVDQLLNELINISNAKTGDGTTVFSGDRALSNAFRTAKGYVEGSGKEVVTSVEYTGTVKPNNAEISEGAYIESNFPGNRIFWAEEQILISSRNSENFYVKEDSSILIDNLRIDLKEGDNIHSVIAKINDSGTPVKASIDPVKNSLMLVTTEPHQIWLEDEGKGTVLKDLGIIGTDNSRPPHNISDEARISGGSAFDMVIKLRDTLYSGNTLDIGSGALKGIQNSINHLVSRTARLGAGDERLELAKNRLEYEIPEMMARDSRETDIDLAEAITELKMLEHTKTASLQTAARILKPTLLDFLR